MDADTVGMVLLMIVLYFLCIFLFFIIADISGSDYETEFTRDMLETRVVSKHPIRSIILLPFYLACLAYTTKRRKQ